MSGETSCFIFEIEHVGMDAQFYHPKGCGPTLSRKTIEAFEGARENAEIFIQHSSDTPFSCAEMLNWFLLQSRTTIADHLPHGQSGTGKVLLSVPIRFARGTFYMHTQDGAADLRALKLMLKVTVRQT